MCRSAQSLSGVLICPKCLVITQNSKTNEHIPRAALPLRLRGNSLVSRCVTRVRMTPLSVGLLATAGAPWATRWLGRYCPAVSKPSPRSRGRVFLFLFSAFLRPGEGGGASRGTLSHHLGRQRGTTFADPCPSQTSYCSAGGESPGGRPTLPDILESCGEGKRPAPDTRPVGLIVVSAFPISPKGFLTATA